MNLLISIVGIPNTGKSTLFNRLVGYNRALVSSIAGTTNDTVTEKVNEEHNNFLLQDTPGVMKNYQHSRGWAKTLESDIVICLVDGSISVSLWEKSFFKSLKRYFPRNFIFVVNKADKRIEPNENFLKLGLGTPILVSALTGAGVHNILSKIDEMVQQSFKDMVIDETIEIPSVLILGRQNSGKSTLFNYLSGEVSSIISKEKFETRDILKKTIEIKGRPFDLYDSPGIIKGVKSQEMEVKAQKLLEDFIDKIDVIMLVIDSEEGLTNYDKRVFSLIKDKQKPLLILVNKKTVKEADQTIWQKSFGFPIVLLSNFNEKNCENLKSQLIGMCYMIKQTIDREDLKELSEGWVFIESLKQEVEGSPFFRIRFKKMPSLFEKKLVITTLQNYFYEGMPVVKLNV
jgi:GTP-binding protein